MQLSASSSVEWRIPPSKCRAFAARILSARTTPCRNLQTSVTAGATANSDQAGVVVSIPGSREDAISAAVEALLGQMKGATTKRKPKKGFSGSSSSSSSSSAPPGTRFSIELPLPSDTPAEAAALAADVLARLPPAAAAEASVVFASEAAAAAAASSAGGLKRAGRVVSLQSACRSADGLGGPLLLVAPTTADVALVDQLLDEVWSGGPWALALNPTWWDTNSPPPPDYRAMVESWEAAYSLTITATQGLMRSEGAVLRQLSPNSSSSSSSSNSPWRVLLKDKASGQFLQVGQLQRRPSQSDLELTFINAKAASSPLTSLVKGVRGIFDKAKK